MKELTVSVPKGYEIDRELSTFENIVFKRNIKTNWENLEDISGWYISENSQCIFGVSYSAVVFNKNLWATNKQAEACLAMSQLSQLMKDVNGEDWDPDWILNANIFCIYYVGYKLECSFAANHPRFLCFKSSEIGHAFLENNRDLIEQARPLL